MKHPFRLSKINIIYVSIIAILTFVINIGIFRLDTAYALGRSLAYFIIPLLFALLLWYILGRKKYGGTTTFNIVLTIVILGGIGSYFKKAKERQKPLNDIQKALVEFKEDIQRNPNSADSIHFELLADFKKTIDEQIKTSVGDEKRVWLVMKDYFEKLERIEVQWNNSFDAMMASEILDFSLLYNTAEYDSQLQVISDYIEKSTDYKDFVQNSLIHIENKINNLNESNKAAVNFMKGFKEGYSNQQPIFHSYINANIAYGQNLTGIIELLKRENGKWKLENDTIVFEYKSSQILFEYLLNNAIVNEKMINELSDKFINAM